MIEEPLFIWNLCHLPSKTKCPLFAELGTPELSSAEIFVCGASAGILAAVLTQPADVVKTRLQLYPHKYTGNGDALVSIVKVIISLSRKTRYVVARMFLQLKDNCVCLLYTSHVYPILKKGDVLPVNSLSLFSIVITFCDSWHFVSLYFYGKLLQMDQNKVYTVLCIVSNVSFLFVSQIQKCTRLLMWGSN